MLFFFIPDAVRAHLDEVVLNRWIGRGGPTSWPARSPDLTPLDFFLWGAIKERVYCTKVRSRKECMEKLEDAFKFYSSTRKKFEEQLQVWLIEPEDA